MLRVGFVVIEDLNHVFSLLNQEKLLSHSQDVTGSVQSIFKRRSRFENLPSSHCFVEGAKNAGRSSAGLVGHCRVVSTT